VSEFVEGPAFLQKETSKTVEFSCPKHGVLRGLVSFSYVENTPTEKVLNDRVYCPACLCDFLDSAIASGMMKRVVKKVITK